MDSNQLKSILVYQKERFLRKKELVPRDLLIKRDTLVSSKEIILISGVRRCGKSTLLKLIAEFLISQGMTRENNLLYINFDDPKLYNATMETCQALYEIFLENADRDRKKYLFFDEIQNVVHWERWLNHLYEFESVKIFITGSNSSILKSDVATLLTGRNRKYELFPFSFTEFLRLKKCTVTNTILPEDKAELRKWFEVYLQVGGFPEAAKQKDPELLRSYYEDIIYRDIIGRNQIPNRRQLLELSKILAANPGMLVSTTQLKKTIGLKSHTTIRNHIQLLTEAYLYHACPLFDFSIKRQIYNPPKIYMADHALSRAVSFPNTYDFGWMLENIVFLELRRRFDEVFYWKSPQGKEVDFVVREQDAPLKAFQVSFTLEREQTKKRELNGLIEMKKALKIVDLNIITYNEMAVEEVDDLAIQIIPVWKWLIMNAE